MKRFLAITGAVVMISVAIVIRSGIDDKKSGPTSKPSGPVTIACVTELAAQCNALNGVDVRIEDASVTAKAIAKGTAGIAGWVTFDPWPEIANQLAHGQAVTGKSERIASSPLVVAMATERSTVLAAACGGAITWKCIGESIGKPWIDLGGQPTWGILKAGIPATSSALGLLLFGNAASGYFGRSDFATNDFDDAFNVWRSSVTTPPALFARFILEFPAGVSAVGTTAQEVAAGKGNRDVSTITPNPSASAVIVLARVNDDRALDVADDLAKLLKPVGWTTPPAGSTGLPNAGVLLALSGLAG